MRRTSTWLVALWIGICSAVGQETTSADDLRKGHQLAIMVCAFCHVAAPDQARMPILDPPVPSFGSIAQRTDISADWLEKFISTTRKNLDRTRCRLGIRFCEVIRLLTKRLHSLLKELSLNSSEVLEILCEA